LDVANEIERGVEHFLPAAGLELRFSETPPAIAITAIDRAGNLSCRRWWSPDHDRIRSRQTANGREKYSTPKNEGRHVGGYGERKWF
jgi:hypothetical protein